MSLSFGLVNAALGPLLQLVALPLSALTLGLFALVVNGVLLAVDCRAHDELDLGGFGDAVLGALVISILTTLLELVLRPIKPDPHAGVRGILSATFFVQSLARPCRGRSPGSPTD